MCRIKLYFYTGSEMKCETNSAAMRKPFQELIHLQLNTFEPRPLLPDSFLGGTAPRLRSPVLFNDPSRGLPKLLLSATHLVELYLPNISLTGYIPPEAMATGLSALKNLESLRLHFRTPQPRPAPESRPPPPIIRPILPSLT